MSDEITPEALKAELDAGRALLLLDVREAVELQFSQLPDIVHIPMDFVVERVSELRKDADIVVICRTGGRSGQITRQLRGMGFPRVRNLVGGMNEWTRVIDPSQKVY